MTKGGVYAGRAWRFGDNVSTDVMMPVSSLQAGLSLSERAAFCMEAIRPGWSKLVRAGDLVVAGKNFGCGSSRPAFRYFKALGIACIAAESVSRLFFRNSIMEGFPIVVCPGVVAVCEDGDPLEIDVLAGTVRNARTDAFAEGEALPQESPPSQILAAGGIEPFLRAWLARRN